MAEPWLPTAGIGACSQGWTRERDGSCAAPVATACESGQFASVARCVPSTTCVAIEGVVTPAGAHVRYVSASATNDGDGSLARPFATIARAMDGAPADAWIVLGPGTYRGPLSATRPVNLVGVCAERVLIDGEAAAPTVTASAGAAVLLRAVSLRGASELGVIVASAGASVSLEDSAITGGVGFGVQASGVGTSVTVARSAIRAMRPRSDGRRGWSIDAESGARVRVEQSHIGDGTNIGVNASGRSTVATVIDSVIEGIRAGRSPGQGTAVSSDGDATTSVERTVLRDIAGIGLYASSGGSISARALQLTRVTQDAPSQLSAGVYADGGGRVTVEESSIVETAHYAGFVRDAGSAIELRSCVLRELARAQTDRTEPAIGVYEASATLAAIRATDVRFGFIRSERGSVIVRGLHLSRAGKACTDDAPSSAVDSDGGALELSEVVADEHRGRLLSMTRIDERASVSRLRVRFSDAPNASSFAALYATNNAQPIDLERAVIERCPGSPCILVEQSSVELRSVLARDFQRAPTEQVDAITVSAGGALRASELAIDGVFGTAIRLLAATSAALERVRVASRLTERHSAIAVGEGATLTARALTSTGGTSGGLFVLGGASTIEDARIETAANDSSVALYAARGGSLTARRLVARGASGFGVGAQDPGTVVTIGDALVEAGQQQRGGDWAIAALDGASITVERAVIRRSPTALTAVGTGATVQATDVFVDELRPREDASNASVIAQVGGSITARRIAVSRGVGAAFATVAEPGASATLALADVYVSEMQLSRVSSTRPEERSNVGLYVRSESAVRCERCALRGSSYGFMVARGALAIEDGAISESLDAAGLVQPDAPPVSLVRVGMNGNARNEVLTGALPDVSFALPTPLL